MVEIYRLSRLPSTADYVTGLTAIRDRITETQLRLLQEQYSAPKRAVTSSELAELVNVQGGFPTVNSYYGRLGHIFCDETGFTRDVRPDNTYRWWAVWSAGYNVSGRGFVWEMLPEVAKALELVGWVSPKGLPLPEEVSFSTHFTEGTICRVTINAYERSPVARAKCIDHYGTNCVVCGFNFSATYGSVGENFIHVHHLRPLAEIGEAYEIDPVADLRPVCANCHSIIHRGNPPYTIEQVQEFLNSNWVLTRD